MIRLISQRLLFVLLVSFGILFLSFFGTGMAANSLRQRPSYNPLTPAVSAVRATLGYVRQLAEGDWGEMSVGQGRRTRTADVGRAIAEAGPRSLALLILSLLLAVAVGVPLGVGAALHQHSRWSLVLLGWSLLGISLPSFCLAALLQVAEIQWYRTFGFALIPTGGFGWDAHLVLPVVVLAARPTAYLARVGMVAFGAILEEDYIRTAHAKGLFRRLVLRRHAWPNALLPLITGIGLSLRFALASLPVVEYMLGWPGLGAALLSAIGSLQPEGVAGMGLVLGWAMLLPTLLLELLQHRLDPRLAGAA